MTLDEFLARLDGVQPEGDQHRALCPGHRDRRPSLVVGERSGKILVHCRSRQCRPEDILRPIGLTLADLFVDSRPRSRGISRKPETVLGAARRNILAAARRQPWARPSHPDWPDGGPTWTLAYAVADLIRELHHQADRLHQLATVDQDRERAWRLVSLAAVFRREAGVLEMALDALVAA